MPTLLATIRRELRALADPAKAPAMQAYMKSAMPFHGVQVTERRAMLKRVFSTYPFASDSAWQKDVLAIWRGARFREERYAAIDLTAHRKARPFQTMNALPMYEEIVVTGAWWDFVDEIAGHRFGQILHADPKPMKKAMRAWSKSDDMWKRRSSILCQLDMKEETDADLLFACIRESMSSREFFLRKGIGWALRQYARTDPRAVARFVREHDAELSGLSKREALKHVTS